MLLLCKVAVGKTYPTKKNMDSITKPPDGYHAVHGETGGMHTLNGSNSNLLLLDSLALSFTFVSRTYSFPHCV